MKGDYQWEYIEKYGPKNYHDKKHLETYFHIENKEELYYYIKNYGYQEPDYFEKQLARDSFDKSLLHQLYLALKFSTFNWIRKFNNSNITQILIKTMQSLLDIIVTGKDVQFYEDDIMDLYNCVDLVSQKADRKLLEDGQFINILFFTIIPNFIKQFTISLKIATQIISNNASIFHSLYATMQVAADLQKSSSILKWIIDSISPSNGLEHCQTVINFITRFIISADDIVTRLSIGNIIQTDGIADAIARVSCFGDSIEQFSYCLYAELNNDQDIVFSIFKTNGFMPMEAHSVVDALVTKYGDGPILQLLLSVLEIGATDSNFMVLLNQVLLRHRFLQDGDSKNKLQRAVIGAAHSSPLAYLPKGTSPGLNKNDVEAQSELVRSLDELCGWVPSWRLARMEELERQPIADDWASITAAREKLTREKLELEETVRMLSQRNDIITHELESKLDSAKFNEVMKKVDDIKTSFVNENDVLINIAAAQRCESLSIPPPPPPPPPPPGSIVLPPPSSPGAPPPPLVLPKVRKFDYTTGNFSFDPIQFVQARGCGSFWGSYDYKDIQFNSSVLRSFIELKTEKKAQAKVQMGAGKESPFDQGQLIQLKGIAKMFGGDCGGAVRMLYTLEAPEGTPEKFGENYSSCIRMFVNLSTPDPHGKAVRHIPNFGRFDEGDLTDLDLMGRAILETPNVIQRVTLIAAASTASKELAEVSEELSLVVKANEEVRTSERFHNFLKLLLFIGNSLSPTCIRNGPSAGLRINTLDSARTALGGRLLRGIASLCLTTEEPVQNIAGFYDDIRSVRLASAVKVSESIASFNEGLLAQIQGFLKISSAGMKPSPKLPGGVKEDRFPSALAEFSKAIEVQLEATKATVDRAKQAALDFLQYFFCEQKIENFPNAAAIIASLADAAEAAFNVVGKEMKERERKEEAAREDAVRALYLQQAKSTKVSKATIISVVSQK